MKSMKPKKIDTKQKTDAKVKAAEEDYSFKEFLKRQNNYKEVFLSRLYKGAELTEIRKQLESGKITMQWYGQPFPKQILAVEHDMVQSTYYDLMTQEHQLKDSLIADGMSEGELKDLLKKGTLKRTFNKNKNPSYLG